MAKKVTQFRYYGNDSASLNYPTNLSLVDLNTGKAFEGKTPIVQLGIQSLPGTHFYLNNTNTSIIIGSTGIYELDLEGFAQIDKLSFAKDSLDLISSNPNAHLIIDIIYDEQEANN